MPRNMAVKMLDCWFLIFSFTSMTETEAITTNENWIFSWFVVLGKVVNQIFISICDMPVFCKNIEVTQNCILNLENAVMLCPSKVQLKIPDIRKLKITQQG